MATDNKKDAGGESGSPHTNAGAARHDDGANVARAERRVLMRACASAIIGIFALAILYTAYFASEILIPMAIAFLLSLVLAPVVGWLTRLHIPPIIGAIIVIIGVLIAFGAGIYGLSTPAEHWVEQAPRMEHKLEGIAHAVSGRLQEFQKATKRVSGSLSAGGSTAHAPRASENTTQSGTPAMLSRVFSSVPGILMEIGVTVVLLYFLLAAGDSFMRSLAHAVPRWSAKRNAVETARAIQYQVSRYLFTITIINLCLGVVDALALWAIGVPSAVLWGVLLGVLNFIPYIGATVAIVMVTFVAFLTFNSIGYVLLVPGALTAVAILEGQFLTPRIVGRRLQLSPVAIFLALVVWGWIWGIAGAIMAVPFLACFKIMCEQIEGLNPIAEFLTVYSTHHKGTVTDEGND